MNGGTTMVINEKNEFLPTRVTGWRICIDYQRLNKVTRKDHFPLPFIDQMLDRLVGNEYFWFLDRYRDTIRSPLLQKIMRRPPSSALMAHSLSGECHLGCVTPREPFKDL